MVPLVSFSKQLKPYLFAPVVHDGSVITIGTKKETDPIDKTEFAKELASIIADFLQIALTLTLISNSAGN